MTLSQPLRRIRQDGLIDLIILALALLGGILFALPLLLLIALGYLGFRRIGMSKPASLSQLLVNSMLLAVCFYLASKTMLGPAAKLIASHFGNAPGVTDGVDFTDWRVYLAYLGIAIFTAGFLEEILFRGYLLQRLEARLPLGAASLHVAFLISNVSFALWHGHAGLDSVIFAFLMGSLISAVFLLIGRRLWPIIIAHALYDVMVISLRFFQIDVPLPTLF